MASSGPGSSVHASGWGEGTAHVQGNMLPDHRIEPGTPLASSRPGSSGHAWWACVVGMRGGHAWWACMVGMRGGHAWWACVVGMRGHAWWACVVGMRGHAWWACMVGRRAARMQGNMVLPSYQPDSFISSQPFNHGTWLVAYSCGSKPGTLNCYSSLMVL